MIVALHQLQGENGSESTTEWWSTPEAHRILEKIKAAHFEKIRYKEQAQKIERGSPLSRDSQALFTASQIGLGFKNAGIGKRSRGEQSGFRNNLIAAYGAAREHPRRSNMILSVHDTDTGRELVKTAVRAAHLVPRSFGKDMLVALFGTNVEEELNTPYNGLLLDVNVEKAVDDGAIAIVPDLPDDPSTLEVAIWESTEPKDYKRRIVGADAEILEEPLEVSAENPTNPTYIRDLEGRHLSFKNDMHPRARYICFLLIGHDTNFAENLPIAPGDDNDPDDTGIVAIAKMMQYHKKDGDDDGDGDGDDDGDDVSRRSRELTRR
ncbi:hypothetical protein DL770_007744 [Monosporascus sp. CRB-9-2]|nr:hypothetical protein DL770_007744 [Monosporascus sp. CRB-9-2]